MELNYLLQEELRRLSELSVQLKEAEKLWAELHTNRLKAEECGADLNVLDNYDVHIGDAIFTIERIKNTIVEHVHLLAALMDAQGND